jgi:hypothetical protein
MARRFSFIVLFIGLIGGNLYSAESIQKKEAGVMIENERNKRFSKCS